MERVVPVLPDGLPLRVRCDQLLLSQLQYLLDHHRGNRVGPRARAHQHRLRDRESEREIDREPGSLALGKAHLDAAAQGGDLVAHHVHADATPGDLRDFLRGGETRVENEIGDLGIGEIRVRLHQTLLDRLGADALDVQSRAVVRQRELNLVAFLPQLAAGASIPCATALRSRCSKGPVMRSSTERSSSTCTPLISRLARLPSSFAVWRTMRYRRSCRLPKGTMRTRIRSCCRSR